jgi:hypothetical protein
VSRGVVLRLIILGLVILLVAWIARNTYWSTTTIPTPLKNEAARNRFYGAQRLVEQLGAKSAWDRFLGKVSPNAAIVVSSWHWDLAEGRRSRMEQWVEAGGRLVLDRTLVGGQEQFERWSGITRHTPTEKEDEEEGDDPKAKRAERLAQLKECRVLHDATPGREGIDGAISSYELCADPDGTHLVTTRHIAYALKDDVGNQVLRVNIGKGSVTVVNGVPFLYRQFLEGDNAALLVAALQLRKNDEVHFLSEEEHPSLLTLMWVLGWPVVLLVLALIALALWRNSVRFGPLTAEPDQARRSLAEQIRGTGLFVMRFGGGKALHAAAVRALNEAAGRRIGAYSRLSAVERIDAVARLTGADASALGPAVNHGGGRRPHELRQAVAFIESVRRRLIRTAASEERVSHGNRVEHDYSRR